MNYKAVIFDMDGLLFDTEIVYYEASQMVADQMGFPYDKELYLKYLGVSDEEVWEFIIRSLQVLGKIMSKNSLMMLMKKPSDVFL